MADTANLAPQEIQSRNFSLWLFASLLCAGFLLRLRLAWLTFLNPDEALHYFLSHQPSLKLAYKASLTTAHPPLMILFLHYWAYLGTSELWLRMPFVIAGTLFCWIMFLWIATVASKRAACFALALCLFLPSLISLSSEIRQYAFLLLFCACCLYFLERAFQQNSSKWMLLSALALYLALLTHYSALIFAVAVGVYALLRLREERPWPAISIFWIAGQLGAIALCVSLYESQISNLEHAGVPSEIASTWLRTSIFHRGEDHLVLFAWTRTLRLFRYFFSHGTIGFLGFLLFVFAISLLLFFPRPALCKRRYPLAALLTSAFLITFLAALAGVYPYGGTRHDILLAIFAILGIAIGFDQLNIRPAVLSCWLKPAIVAAALIICSFFQSPAGPYIRPRHQRRRLMHAATDLLNSLPADSAIFTDSQGSMVLNYYLCHETMRLPFAPGTNSLQVFRCGNHRLVAVDTLAGFDRNTFPDMLRRAWESVPAETTLHMFQSGWIDDKEDNWLADLRRLGGTPKNFGPNILVCVFQRATPEETQQSKSKP
jgi:hypothetical protein